MWLVVRYRVGYSPVVVAMFGRCCQAMEIAAQLQLETPTDKLYARLESNFIIRQRIDDIPTACEFKNTSKKPRSKADRFVGIKKYKEVVSDY